MKDKLTQPGGSHWSEEGIRIISQCPVCHWRYDPLETKILDEHEGSHLLFIKCKNCQSGILALITANNFGISSVGLVTDLDSCEVMKFRDLAEVKAEDVLRLHENLDQLSASDL